MTATVEVRVPTYRRPELLRRALASLIKQTYRDWAAYVFDDSASGEAAAVVQEMGCKRIKYRPNRGNLGSAANIDHSFNAECFGDASFACVLEDDNWIYPDFIERSVKTLQVTGLDIAMVNQDVWEQDGHIANKLANTTTRGLWMQEGVIDVGTLRSHLFFHEGISNGGLFWRLNAGVNLEVCPSITNTWLQEKLRTLRVAKPLVFLANPAAAFTLFKGRTDHFNSQPQRLAEYHFGAQALLRHIIHIHGRQIVLQAQMLATTSDRLRTFEHSLVRALYPYWQFRSISYRSLAGLTLTAIRSLLSAPGNLRDAVAECDPISKIQK